MLEKPQIQEPEIVKALAAKYGLQGAKIDFLPLGNDVNTAAYRVETADKELYLKLRRGDFNAASVMVPYLLKEHGVQQVIAPIATQDEHEWTRLNEYSLALYPYVHGHNGFEHPLSDEQWVELGSAVKGLHTLAVLEDIATTIPREDYSSVYRDAVRSLMQHLDSTQYPDQVASAMAEFLQDKIQEITHMLERAEELGAMLQGQQQDLVLCHADLHAGNVLIDRQDRLYIIDWDTLLFAPKERDLMFIGAGIGSAWNRPEEAELFYQGYGKTEINRDALIYYRYERFIEDIEEFAKRLLLTGEGGKDRARSLRKFINAFAPNNVVDRALQEQVYEPQ